MPAEISIIIVSYNVSRLLQDCLRSIQAQNFPGTEIIVIDNQSTDDSVPMIRALFPGITLVENKYNAGFSSANNQGMALATGRYLLLLNPDTILHPGTLTSLFQFAQNHVYEFVLGPRLVNRDGSLQVSAWKEPSVADMVLESLFLHTIFTRSNYPAENFAREFSPGMISGAALFFPRVVFEKLGGLDPLLFWMEDADFCYRAKRNGMRIVYFPGAAITHLSGESSKRNLNVVISNQLLSKLKFYRKHFGFAAFAIGAYFCFIHIGTRFIGFAALTLFDRSKGDKLLAYEFALKKYFRFIFQGDKSLT
jgi:GT2 family glycosyltransferase